MSSSNALIKQATMFLTAFLCQGKVPAELAKSYTLDRLKVIKLPDDVHYYLVKYMETIGYINSGRIEVGEVS